MASGLVGQRRKEELNSRPPATPLYSSLPIRVSAVAPKKKKGGPGAPGGLNFSPQGPRGLNFNPLGPGESNFHPPGPRGGPRKKLEKIGLKNLKKKIEKSVIFSLFIGILKPGSFKIERGMKKYFRGLIMRFFGLMGGSLVPGEGSS